jgi:hypothetical protein
MTAAKAAVQVHRARRGCVICRVERGRLNPAAVSTAVSKLCRAVVRGSRNLRREERFGNRFRSRAAACRASIYIAIYDEPAFVAETE